MSPFCTSCKSLREELFVGKCGHNFCKQCIAISYVTENPLCASNDQSIDMGISISNSENKQTQTQTTQLQHIEKDAGQVAVIAKDNSLVDSGLFHFSYVWKIEDLSEIKEYKCFYSCSFKKNKFKGLYLALYICKCEDPDISCKLRLTTTIEDLGLIEWPIEYSATLTLLDRYSGKDVRIIGNLEEIKDSGRFSSKWMEYEIETGYDFLIPISLFQPPYFINDTFWLKCEIAEI